MKNTKIMKKSLLLLTLLLMVTALSACSLFNTQEAQEEKAEVESNYEGVLSATGIDLPAPEGAVEVEYSYYNLDPMMAEMDFELNGSDYTLRVQKSTLTSLEFSPDDQLDADALRENYGDISGEYYKWDAIASVVVQDCTGYYAVNNKHCAIVNWLDTTTGYMYSLCYDEENAVQDVVVQVADLVFGVTRQTA